MSWFYESDMCIYYNDTKKIDMGNITEVRTGFSTDTLNDIEKRLKQEKKIKIGQCTEDNCFSIIFDPRYSGFLMLNYLKHVQNNLPYITDNIPKQDYMVLFLTFPAASMKKTI